MMEDALGWQGLVYIGESVNPEPSDQTDLKKNGVDANPKAVENRHRKEGANRWAQGPASLQVGPGCLSPSALVVCLLESSRTFWSCFRYE
jgi:hypothetical protein